MLIKKALLLILVLILSLTMISCSKNSKDDNKETTNNEANVDYSVSKSKNWNTELMSEDISKIIKKKTLVVGMVDSKVDIFYYLDKDGKPAGIDVNIAQDIADILGVKLVINTDYKSENDMIYGVESGKVDLAISGLTLTTPRAAYISFSKPYIEDNYGILVNKSRLVNLEIEDNPLDYMRTHKVKIGAVEGTAYASLLKEQFPDSDIVLMKDTESVIKAVAKKKLFACVGNKIDFTYFHIKNPKLALYVKGFEFTDARESICIGVASEKQGLLRFVNAYIDSMTKITMTDIEKNLRKHFNY